MNNISEIRKSFEAQAEAFDSQCRHLSDKDYLDYIVLKTEPSSNDSVLEVAAGTCICGRAFAPYVKNIICLDATPAMLDIGKSECRKSNIQNIDFTVGLADDLPFKDNSFDIVISRLAFHHFTDPEIVFKEMKRVLKTNGKLVVIDMIANDISFRGNADKIEAMRDNSHVKNLSLSEMRNLYFDNSVCLKTQEQTDMRVSLKDWMELTKVPEYTRTEISRLMLEDIGGRYATGFSPYLNNNSIYFNQHWVFSLGIKQ